MNKDTNEKIRAIREEFINSLPLRINKIQALTTRIVDHEWDGLKAKELVYEVHNLRGFSGSHGLMLISQAAAKAEQLIDAYRHNDCELTDADKKSLQTAVEELVAIMQETIKNTNSLSNQMPIVQVSPHTTIANAAEESKIEAAKTTANVPLILIVDDDQHYCEILAAQLINLGYRTKSIFYLEDLEQSIHTYSPKAIFMDIIFQDGESAGTQLISKLRAKDEIQCPVVYISARDELNSRLSAVRSGGTAFINKNFTLNDLKNILDANLPLHRNITYRVLIIDDDKSMNAYCTAILENAGIHVTCLETINEIFEYILNFDPDVILLDMYMPNINGLEMASVLRQHQSFSSIPIVIMSGETDINKQFIMRSVGADDFILKPFKPHHLVDIILNRIQRSRQTKKLIYTDGLTGLMLFSKIKEQVLNLMESCLRYNLDFSIAFIDIDNFKRVNDTYGHLVGDEILREFAEYMITRLRRSDMVTRYGGEEFAIILPYTNSDNAIRALNSIRDSYAQHTHQAKEAEFFITFSVGVSSIAHYQDLESLLAAADAALYRAKQAGGNAIEIATYDE